MADKLEELKLAYEEAEREYKKAHEEFDKRCVEKREALRKYERELYKHENCKNCKYSVISDNCGDHNICGCPEAPCTCCNVWCDNYQPDTPLTKAIKDNLDCYIDLTAYEGLKQFYGDILEKKGSINPDDEGYNPIARTLYNILKARYGEKER